MVLDSVIMILFSAQLSTNYVFNACVEKEYLYVYGCCLIVKLCKKLCELRKKYPLNVMVCCVNREWHVMYNKKIQYFKFLISFNFL